MIEKKDGDRRRYILKEERTSERKTREESIETDDKKQCYGVSCCMDHRHGQISWTGHNNKLRNAGNDWRKKSADTDTQI